MSDLTRLLEVSADSNEFAARLLEVSRAIVLLLDLEGRVLFYNAYLEQLSGWPLSEVRGRDWFDTFLPARDHDRIRRLFGRALAGEPVVDNVNPIRTRAGAERDIEWSGSILRDARGDRLGVLNVGIDVTDRTRLEQRQKLQGHLVDEVSDAIISTDPEGRIETWNRAAERIYGFTASEVMGRQLGELLATDYADTTREQTLDALQAEGKWSGEVIQYAKDGSALNIQANVSITHDATGRVRGMVGVNRDMSDRVSAERRYRAIFEQQHQLAGILSADGTVLDANPRALELAGVSRTDVVGKPFWETPWWSHSEDLQARLRDAIQRASAGETVRFEAEHPRGRGGMAVVDFSIRPILDAAGNVELLIPEGADITEQRRLQRQLADRERLAAIGTTAAMFAHEIANPLNSMTLQGTLLTTRLRKLDVGDSIMNPLELLLDEVRRLADMLGEFRTLARRETMTFRPMHLGRLVDEVIEFHVAPHQTPALIVERNLPADMPAIPGSADKLKQVVVNLCKNAVEAMPDGGTLRIEGSYCDDSVTLRVTDTGIGIPEGIDVFQPFETTKPTGTGLGLSIARQIAQAHGGELDYETRVRQGTTFELRLPRGARDPSAAARSEASTRVSAGTRNET